jgi:hypothetical protein
LFILLGDDYAILGIFVKNKGQIENALRYRVEFKLNMLQPAGMKLTACW